MVYSRGEVGIQQLEIASRLDFVDQPWVESQKEEEDSRQLLLTLHQRVVKSLQDSTAGRKGRDSAPGW